jgi:hypothetical protein
MSDKNPHISCYEEEMLDDALDHSFPASDPPSLINPSTGILQSHQPVQTRDHARFLRAALTDEMMPRPKDSPPGRGTTKFGPPVSAS